jgi:N-6 DNA Methylase
MIGHFLPFFLDPSGPTLLLSDAFQQIDLRAYYRDNFEAIATRRTFVVADQSFTLNGFRLQSSIVDHHELIYGANYRAVMSERLSRFLRSLKNKLHDPAHGPFIYLGFIQSSFLDAKVNSERTDFSIPREPPTEKIDVGTLVGNEPPIVVRDLLADEIDLKSIRDAALMAVKEDLKPYLDEINTSKEAALNSYIAEDAPQYRVLLRHKSEFIDQIPPDASKDEMEMALHRQLYERQVELKKEGRRILAEVDTAPDNEEFYQRFDQYVSDANEIGKTALAQYVVHRRVIVELLDRALSRDGETGRYGLEKTVHSLVFPMRTTSDDVPLEQQNLWIIDERLTFHSFLSSDKPLNDLAAIENDSESRPDILIFNRALAFSEGEQPLTSLVVIEFKKPMRTGYPDEDPVTQVYRMVRDVRSGQFKDSKGQLIRTLTNDVPASNNLSSCRLLALLLMTVLAENGRAGVVLPDNVLFEGGAGETIRRRLLQNFDFHTLLRLPTGIFYKQGVKANVLFFDKKPVSEKANTRELWIYDLRTNQRFTLKERPMVRADIDDFVACYASGTRRKRWESERFRRFAYGDLVVRDKVNLDIFWLKDDALDDPDLLPPPEEVAAEIVENLETALERFRRVASALGRT